MSKAYTEAAKEAIELAQRAAVYHKQPYAGTEHLLVGLLKEGKGTASQLLKEAGAEAEKLENLIDNLIAPEGGTVPEDKPDFSPRLTALFEEAEGIAEDLSSEEIGTEHLLAAMLSDRDCVGTRLLHTMRVDLQKLGTALAETVHVAGGVRKEELRNLFKRGGSGEATPTLDQFSRDLTRAAAEGRLDPVVGREREIRRVMQVLSRRTKNNPCLIGEPGVGKTAIVEGIARKIAEGSVPQAMQGKRVVVLDLSGMVAGTKYRGEFEERIRKLVQEVSSNSDILLFIDELHTLIGAGGAEGALDAANILKPSLSRGELQVIGATTVDEYRKYIEKDGALERRFQPIQVEEPSEEEAVRILEGLRPYYEKHHKVKIRDEALKAAVQLSARYINDRSLPDKAIDLIDEAAAKVQLAEGEERSALTKEETEWEETARKKEEAILKGDFRKAKKLQEEQDSLQAKLDKKNRKEKKKGKKEKKACVGAEQVAEAAAEWTGIPVAKIAESESRRLQRLEKELHKRIIGQEEAVSAVASAIRRGRVGLKDPNRPTGSFLFLGPTGVGKTELSKAVAETVYGSEQNMIRVDMSEYMEKHSVSRMIGSPPGYVGHEDGGQLSEQVRRHPYSVILFDEIEKAHPDVFNVLLQVLDEGHITDSRGRRVDFRNTCIIMTSNAGAKAIVDPKKLGFSAQADEKKDYEAMKSGVMEEVKRLFRPEFLNRIDEIIVFHPLAEAEVEQIVTLLFSALKKRADAQMGIKLSLLAAARKQIAENGFSSKYGARPIRRMIQTEVENPLSEMLLGGELSRGDRVQVGLADKKITLKVIKRGEETEEKEN